MPESKLAYRPEVDGLRAIAVILVILYHAEFETFSHGYIGVDAFFTISGYLITSIILKETSQGSFSIIDFLHRRARRLLPALIVTIFLTLPFAWLLLSPKQLIDFSQSLISVVFFSSNFLFATENGYFETISSLKPLQHTWSLAIEEQFYLLFPLLFIVFSGHRRRLTRALILLFIISFFLSIILATSNPNWTFYFLPTRAWELLLGSLVAVYLDRKNRHNASGFLSEYLSFTGIIGLLYFATRNASVGNYSIKLLLVNCFVALIIIFATRETLIGKILGSRLLVSIGLISYGVYLLHHPIFVFARLSSPMVISPPKYFFLIVLTFVFAALLWKYIETPIRKGSIRRKVFMTWLFSISISLIAVAAISIKAKGFPDRLPVNITWTSLGEKLAAEGKVCDPQYTDTYSHLRSCDFGDLSSKKRLLIYGDSHAESLMSSLNREFMARGIKGTRLTFNECGVIPNIVDTRLNPININSCSQMLTELVRYIKANKSAVIVAGRWSFALFPVEGEINLMPFSNTEGGVEAEDYREYAVIEAGELVNTKIAKQKAFTNFVEELLSTQSKVYFVYPIPEIGWDIFKVNWLSYKFNQKLQDTISIPEEDYTKRNRFVLSILRSFEPQDNFIPIDPSQIFCNSFVSNRCIAQYQTIPLYYDDDHLSDYGAQLVVSEILRSSE